MRECACGCVGRIKERYSVTQHMSALMSISYRLGPQEDAGIPGCCFAYITRKLVSVSTSVRLSDCAFALS